MRTSVDTFELQAAAAVHEEAAEGVGALADALSRQAAAAHTWCSGELRGAAERFLTTLAWAASTGAVELSRAAGRLRGSADGYDGTETAFAGRLAPRAGEDG